MTRYGKIARMEEVEADLCGVGLCAAALLRLGLLPASFSASISGGHQTSEKEDDSAARNDEASRNAM